MIRFAFVLISIIQAWLVAAVLCCGQSAEYSQAIDAAIEYAQRSVVQIETIGGVAEAGQLPVLGPFSGTVVEESGLILTASFCLKHDPASIFVRLSGKEQDKRYLAGIVAKDESRHLTLLKIDCDEPLVAAVFGNGQPEQGSRCIAVGKYFDRQWANVSVGVVSATGRIWNRAVQTDCKVSRQNYGGPLVGIDGKAMGILVPASPGSTDVSAGAQWYDSGIGFAAVVDPKSAAFARLAAGERLRSGLLGVKFEGSDPNDDPATVAFCLPTSPAGKAGIVEGDTIVAIDSEVVSRIGQFKHAIGPRYENEIVKVTVERDSQNREFDVELAGEIDPYLRPEFGFQVRGVTVAAVVPDSPCAEKVQPGDVIESVGPSEVTDFKSLQSATSKTIAGTTLEIVVERDGETLKLEVQPRNFAASPPADLPGPIGSEKAEVVGLEMAGSANVCFAIVPQQDGESKEEMPLMVWLPTPGPVLQEDLVAKLKPLCLKWNVVVLVPQSLDSESWMPDDIESIVASIEKLSGSASLSLDRSRIAIAGKGTGGEMALLTGFSQRSKFSGVGLIDGQLGARLPSFENLPSQPMQVLVFSKAGLDAAGELAREEFEKAGFPFALNPAAMGQEMETTFRWVWFLNRL